jgi:membrane protein implicated in regulation of membrane protease activity
MNKRFGPTVVLILVIFFILVFAGSVVTAVISDGLGIFWTVVLLIVPFAIIVALITVYIERMREIREEEKDDLRKY